MNNSREYIEQQLTEITAAIGSLKEGGNIDEIKVALDHAIELRTLQRRLKTLLTRQIIGKTGHGKATKYFPINPVPAKDKDEWEEERTLITLSKKAQLLQDKVSQPIQRRNPVGYNKNFLKSYQPNQSEYLGITEKSHLKEIGFTGLIEAPGGTYAKQILQRLLIDLSWNSSRLEGNTYSLLETRNLLDQGVHPEDKSERETQMILNHKDAIEFIVQNTPEIGFNRYTILNLHGLLSNNLLPDPAASGRLRIHGVGIGGSVYTPISLQAPIEEMFDLMLQKAEAISDPFEQAFFIMVQLPYLQPFDDVNKRVSRLAANIPLNRQNLSPLSFIEVPEKLYIDGLLAVYELNDVSLLRDIFIWAYERSAQQYSVHRQSLGEPDPFRIKYRDVIRTLIREMVDQAASPEEAALMINAKSLHLPGSDRTKFIQTVNTELHSLHAGNFARYYILPSQFKRWQQVFNKIDS